MQKRATIATNATNKIFEQLWKLQPPPPQSKLLVLHDTSFLKDKKYYREKDGQKTYNLDIFF